MIYFEMCIHIIRDVASPFVEPQEPRPGMKGDDESDDDSSLLAYQVAPKDAKSFLRVRRGWIKGITGEEEEEEEASQRERNREQNERNAEASALARWLWRKLPLVAGFLDIRVVAADAISITQAMALSTWSRISFVHGTGKIVERFS